jgi:hypothetical protein
MLARYQDWYSRSAYLHGSYLTDIKCLVDRIRRRHRLQRAPVDYQKVLENAGEQMQLFTAEALFSPIAITGPSRAHGSLQRVGTCA